MDESKLLENKCSKNEGNNLEGKKKKETRVDRSSDLYLGESNILFVDTLKFLGVLKMNI